MQKSDSERVPTYMGVYEGPHLSSPSMHWQQVGSGTQMLASAYDPSGDLSPNLPCQESSDSAGSGCSTTGSISSACCKSEFTGCRECSPEPLPPGGGGGGGGGGPCRPGSGLAGGVGSCKEEVVCAGCHLRITDRFYLFAVDRRWHASCLQCCQCRLPLDGEVTCFARDGSIFCKRDYYRLFGMKRCARCQAAISSTELVMRARELVFHVHCFTCAVCSALLTKGDTFGMREGAVFCRLHFAELPPLALSPYPPPPGGPQPPPPPSSDGPHPPPPGPPFDYHSHPRLTPPPGGPPDSGVSAAVKIPNAFFPNGGPPPRQKGRPRKRKPKDLEGMTANLDLNAESYLDVAFGPGTPGLPGANGAHHARTKRMRTSFKHHQLRTMKSYFAINHNPDAKDLKQLSQKTGLPKRVLQVWFQNARAKWRRMVLKQEGGGGLGKDKLEAGGGGGPGGGLEAYHHSLTGPHGSPYLSPSPLECSS